ncbi:MAG: ornithine carbamoyltransferase [Candidatus Methanofastidiosia archaeon]
MIKCFKERDFICLNDFSCEELYFYLHIAQHIKYQTKLGLFSSVLRNKNLAMIFQKPSLRTRTSFQIGMNQLGGSAVYISPNEIQLGKRESTKDVACVLSGYVDGIMARVFSHEDILDLAEHANVPVINGLSDLLHPCQALADYLTILEHFGRMQELTLCYVGDGNNVCHSLMYGASKFGVNMKVACPKGYEPDKKVQKEVGANGLSLTITNDPIEGVCGADIVYTDTWTSMGQEKEHDKRLRTFIDFQLSSELLAHAKDDHIVMHCLPAHRGEEITDEVIDGPHSVVYGEAENRLHAQKAILALNL